MNDYPNILAKTNPKQTLFKHTEDCLSWLSKVLIWNDCFIKTVSKRYSISLSLLKRRLFLTVALHDIGKATCGFQNKIHNQINSAESHALASVPFIFKLLENNPIIDFEGTPYYPEILAVASHHSKLRKKLFDSYNNIEVEYIEEIFFTDFFSFINQQAVKFGFNDWNEIKVEKSMFQLNPFVIFKDEILSNIEEDGFQYEKSDAIRDLFMLFKSILHYCDWLASSGNNDYEYSPLDTTETITTKMKEKINDFDGWLPFQSHLADCGDKNVFVQVPTGQGKTEAAVLWAINKNENQKILFLLPTMVTTNKMWNRMRFLLGGDEKVGLSHSSATYILKEQNEDIEPEVLRNYLLYNRTFFKPVTVATIDQLIYSYFNWGYWVLTGLVSNNSKIIIDEIHVYDPYTFGLLVEVIKCIMPYHSKLAIMSASLPSILVEEIKKIIPSFEIISDPNFDNVQRHVLNISESYIEDHAEDILCDYKLNRKVLVVCNTIRKAREVYDILECDMPVEKIMLYHSQFVLVDKIEKENFLEDIKNVDGGFVAICTQIVEVSLDVDFDVLYTENAPIDAIIQRLGRVNRKGVINMRCQDLLYAKAVVTQESEVSAKYVYHDLYKVLRETYKQLSVISKEKNGNLTEFDYKRIVDEVYTNTNLGNEYFSILNEGRSLIHKLWNEYLHKIYTLDVEDAKLHEISSRKCNYITVESVLLMHYKEYNFDDVIEKGDYELLRKYTLKVPIHIAKKYAIRKINNSDIYILDMKYDKFKGLSLEIDDQIIM